MKKYIIAVSILLTLVGCSASASIARAPFKPVVKTQAVEQDTFLTTIKIHNNTKQMNKVIKYLKTRVGKTPYVFSGSSPRGWDCSGLVRWTYERFGLELPHSANKQAHVGTRVSKPKVGDIVVFAYPGSTNFYHSAIYIGNGKIINAHNGASDTIIQPLSDYKNSQIRYVRVVPTL